MTLSTSGGAEQQTSPFLEALLKKLSEAEDHKPGAIVRLVQPLLLAHPLESMEPDGELSMLNRHFFIMCNYRNYLQTLPDRLQCRLKTA